VAIKRVEISGHAKRDLRKLPTYVVDKLLAWVGRVEKVGVEEVRKIKGYHDEPLHGDRAGQRSIRLTRSYRAIYEIRGANRIEFISIEEVNKHDY
jgi:proteic killer suppression protein